MNIFRRYQLSRDRGVTVANLVDELLVGKEIAKSPYRKRRLSSTDLHAEVCSIDAFLRQVIALRPGQPVAIYRSNNRECFHWFLAIIRAGGIAVPLNPQLSLAEVRRILADSGTDILVTDRAVFERNIGDRQALNVRTWIQADDENGDARWIRARLRDWDVSVTDQSPSIRPQPLPSFILPAPVDFPKAQPCPATHLLGARSSTVLCWDYFWARETLRSSRCPGRTSWL